MHCTILIPAWNTEKYIGDALTSCIRQTHKDLDVLVSDDASTDGTVGVVEKHMLVDPRISLLRNKEHLGAAGATAAGLVHCKGPVVTILDSDDWMMRSSLEDVLPFFRKDPALGIVWTRFQCLHGGRGWSGALPSGCKSLWEALYKYGWWRAQKQVFFRLEVYQKSKKLDPAIQMASDYQLVAVLAETGCKALHLSVETYVHRNVQDKRRISVGHKPQQKADSKKVWALIERWAKEHSCR